jgi:hypothetical protein
MSLQVPISIGELWDKYTILLIKKEKITDVNKVHFVLNEIELLDKLMVNYSYSNNKLFSNLKKINEKLWEVEDQLRIKETQKQFDNDFIELARMVYYTNDKRAEIKKEINILFNSIIHEVKDYIKYN